MYEDQTNNYYSSQGALDNIAFTNENIQNNLDMCTMLKESNEIQKKHMEKIDMDQMQDTMMDQREMQMEVTLMNEEMKAQMDNSYDSDDLDEQ